MYRFSAPTVTPAGVVRSTDTLRWLVVSRVQLWITQLAGHWSPSTVLPSSHDSPGSMKPLPHPGATGGSALIVGWMQLAAMTLATSASPPVHGVVPSAFVKAFMR